MGNNYNKWELVGVEKVSRLAVATSGQLQLVTCLKNQYDVF